MNITRFEPWTILSLMHRDLNGIAARRFDACAADDSDNKVTDWVPAVDIVEQEDRFVLRADLPGVSPDAINVNMENGILSLSGERSLEIEDTMDGLKRLERASGKFYRRFNLPESADAEGISARSANGILEISIPKAPQVLARRIEVEAA